MAQQSTIIPWLRRLIVTIGPVEEWRGSSGGSGDVLRFESDGTQDNLKIVASVSKTVMGSPQPSNIAIYGLSRQTRNSIQRSLTKITIEAGWDNTEIHKVFQGSVVSVVSERQGADIVTKINAIPGYGALIKSTTSVNYAPNSTVQAALKDLGGKLPGVAVSDANIKEVEGEFGPGGWSYAGTTKDGLTSLANEFGFSWHIEDNALCAVGDKAKFDGVVILEGNQGGLITVTPIMQGPLQVQTGVKIKGIYVPGVQPGGTVRVRSTVSEGLDGDYRVHTAKYSLDPCSDAYTMELESFRYF